MPLITKISKNISIPLIAAGGAGSLEDLKTASDAGIPALAAGSLFVFVNKNNRSFLINYPNENELKYFYR